MKDPKGIKLFSLPSNTDENELREELRKFGSVERIYMPVENRRAKGYAIINFKDEKSAKKALEAGEITIGFSTVTVNEAYQKAFRLE